MSQDSGSQTGQEQAVREEISDELLANVADTNEELPDDEQIDVDGIIESSCEEYDDYATNIIANFAEGTLRSAVEQAKAETVKGIIAGSRDRHGSNAPRRHSVVRSSGDHEEVSTWDGSLPGPNGAEVEIPNGKAIVAFECDYQEQYDSYQGVGISSIKPLSLDDMAEKLQKVAISPDDLVRGDQYEIVVVKGTISYVDTQTLFVDDGEGGREPGPEGDVLMQDSRGELQPHMEVSIAKEGETSVRAHIERQSDGRPFFGVESFSKVVNDAYEKFDEGEAQAKFVRQALQGTDIIVVGNVNSYEQVRNDGGVTNYVDIATSAIIQQGVESDDVEDADESEDSAEEESEEPADEAGEPYEGGEEEAEEEAEEDDEPEGDVGQVADDIETYAGLVGEDVDDLTATDVKENAAGIDAPQSVIEHALRQLQSDDSSASAAEEEDEGDEEVGEDGEEEESGGGQSLEQQFADLEENSMYQCPGDDCPGKGSSMADLLGHVMEDHEVGSAADAKDWLAERV